MPLPEPIVPLNEVALIDAAAMARGHDLADLMEHAGHALAEACMRVQADGPVLIACGPGNNGGDGYVCARLLAQQGREVRLLAAVPPKSRLCQIQAQRCHDLVPTIIDIEGRPPTLIVDAILGAGANGRLRDPLPQICERLGRWDAPVIAADAPTGLGSESVLRATETICFQVAKREVLDDDASGTVRVVDVGIHPECYRHVHPVVLRRYPTLIADGHKGDHGEVMVVGGGVFPGALHMSCVAALHSGADMVRAWTTQGPSLPPTVIAHRQSGDHLVPDDREALPPLLARCDCVLIGPGLGRYPSCREAARQAFHMAREMDLPVVVDADAINALTDLLRDLPELAPSVVITPHHGEAKALLGGEADHERLHAFARRDRIILAKGKDDLITDGIRWQLNPRGNPRMAVGGTGDCLAGMTAGLIAGGCDAFDAARMAALWLCTCADDLWQELGPCYTPLDILPHLGHSLRRLMQEVAPWPPVRSDH